MTSAGEADFDDDEVVVQGPITKAEEEVVDPSDQQPTLDDHQPPLDPVQQPTLDDQQPTLDDQPDTTQQSTQPDPLSTSAPDSQPMVVDQSLPSDPVIEVKDDTSLEDAMPTDTMPDTQPTPPPTIQQPTLQARHSASATIYPHSVTTSANIPVPVSRQNNPLALAPPLPNDTPRGRSGSSPKPTAAKIAKATPPPAATVPTHSMKFKNNPDPDFTQQKHDLLLRIPFPTSQNEQYNFHVALYFFIPSDAQPIAHPTTLASCNVARDSKHARPFFCVRCTYGFPTLAHFCNHHWTFHMTDIEKGQWRALADAGITPHDLLWRHSGESLSLTPLPHDQHALAT